MKRQILACFYMCMVGVLYAGDATIDEVVTFQRGDKTSVVITYAGTEKLRFFALDSTDGVFSLDLPGVFSHFDFASLSFNQVKEVKQLALDPDVSNGIRVSFVLKQGVTYEIFESGAKELTLYFEGGIPDEEVPVAVAEDIAEVDAAVPVSAPVNTVQKSMAGTRGEGRLYEVAVDAAATGGKLFLSLDHMEKYTHFFLENPKRFVLDLRGTVLGLAGNDLALDHPLVDRVRIRQFQSHPVPITRLVLDLNAETQVNVTPADKGLVVIFGQSTEAVAALMAETDGGVAEVSHVEQAQALEETQAIPSFEETVAARESEPANEVVAEVIEEAPVVAEQAPAELVGHDAEAGESVEETHAVASTESIPDDAAPVVDEVALDPAIAEDTPYEETEQDVIAQDHTEQVEEEAVASLQPEQAEVEILEEQVVQTEPAAEVVAEPVAEVVAEPIVETVAEPAAEVVEEAVVAIAQPEVVSEPAIEVAQAPVEASYKSIDQEMDTFESETFTEEEPEAETLVSEASEMSETKDEAAQSEPVEEVVVLAPMSEREDVVADASPMVEEDTEADYSEPVRGVEDPFLKDKNEETSSFVMASDVDLEMEEFLKEDSKSGALYHQMKGYKSTRRNRGSVQITNSNIASHKVLVESRNMQDEEEASEADFDELFREEEDSIRELGEDEPEYRGFDIMIDIREQPVLDLLRFLADEVGFNLFVDNSVSNITATYRFRNIPWDQALDIILTNANLDKEFRNGVLRVATTEKFRQEEEARAQLRLTRELSVPTETVTVDLNYARARDIVPIVSEYLSPRGSIIRDDRTNILIIRDIPKFMIDIRTLINRLDKRIPQVSIEARIVQTTTRFLRELGIQWGLTAAYAPETGTETGLDFPHRIGLGGPRIGVPRSSAGPEGGYAVNLPIVSENPSGLGLTLGNFLDNFKLDISMQLLESEGQGQIISSPKITTQNNRTAVITNGQRIPIQTIQRGTVTTRFIDAVLELQVTPQITADETIIMDLVVDKSEPDFSRASGAGGNPIINTSRAETQVLVKNGGTAVIGGIFALNEQVSETGMPKLRKIPVLKRLFSSQNKQYENQELLIFVTPKIVKY